MQPTRLGDIEALSREEFVARLGFVAEGSPWVAEDAWARRPFGSRQGLIETFSQIIHDATGERKLALVQAHPDLVGRVAVDDTSRTEQAAAGLGELSSDEIATFRQLNAQYKERFGFPFVICARENKKSAILAGFRERLTNARDEELATAIVEVCTIVALRLHDAVAE